jgi:hypothetical protein
MSEWTNSAMPVTSLHESDRGRTRQKEAKIKLLIPAAQHTAHCLIAARTGNRVKAGRDG